MVLARNRRASAHFHDCLISGRVSKNYSALLCGVLRKPRTVTAKLRKTHPTPNENQVIIDPQDGKEAVSHFACSASGHRFSLADVEIETGRTHQIRVHAASIGHPILGDERYGDKKLNDSLRRQGAKGMFLHARELKFPDIGENAVVRKHEVAVDPLWRKIVSW